MSVQKMSFQPTTEELLVLVRHWAKRQIRFHLNYFLFGDVCCRENRIVLASYDRVDAIAGVIGEDAVRAEFKKVEREEAANVGPELWDKFLHDDTDEMRHHHEKMAYTNRYLTMKVEDNLLVQAAFTHLCEDPCGAYFDHQGDVWTFALDPHCPADLDAPLVLKVTTKEGASQWLSNRTRERPSSWYAPYGL